MSRDRIPACALLLLTVALSSPSTARAGDDGGMNMGMSATMARQMQAAELAASLEGTWTVTVDPLDVPGGCESVPSPEPRLWTVTSSDSDLVVKQAADAAFPNLAGYVVSDTARGIPPGKAEGWSVVLWGAQAAGDGRSAAVWLDVRLGGDGKLGGTWRYLGWHEAALPSGGRGVVPCFADFRVVGKR